MLVSILIFCFAFALLWVGSGLAISAVTRLSRSFRMSGFSTSFLMLGLFTSFSEIAVGVNAFIDKEHEIFVGNLIGSSVVVFLFITPLLAFLGRGLKLNHNFSYKDLISALFVIGMPALLSLDRRIGIIDAIVCVSIYSYFFYMRDRGFKSIRKIVSIKLTNTQLHLQLLKILTGIGLLLYASNLLVTQTVVLGESLNISTFFISLLVISVGTNIPEIAVAIRSVLAHKNDIAFGNYVGSSALNTLELGVLTLGTRGTIHLTQSSPFSLVIFLIGLGVFAYLAKSKNDLSRNEAKILLLFYFAFITFEVIKAVE